MKLYSPTSPKIEQVPIQVIEQVLNKLCTSCFGQKIKGKNKQKQTKARAPALV